MHMHEGSHLCTEVGEMGVVGKGVGDGVGEGSEGFVWEVFGEV